MADIERAPRVYVRNGERVYIVKSTESCTGCHTTNEGYSTGDYDYDEKAKCEIGSGCHECGYTGKRRSVMYIPVDYDPIAALPQDAAEKPVQERKDG